MEKHRSLLVFTRTINPRVYNNMINDRGEACLSMTKHTREEILDVCARYNDTCTTFNYGEQLAEAENDLNIDFLAVDPQRLTMYEDNAYVLCRPIKDKGELIRIDYYLLRSV